MERRIGSLDPAESKVWIALTVFSHLLAPAMDQRLRSIDLTLFEFGCLMSLADAPTQRLRITAMAERTYAPVPRTSKVVGRLEGKGLVSRVRSSADARAWDITLTTEGKRRIHAALPIHAAAARDMVLQYLSRKEIETVGVLLARVVSGLDPSSPLGRAPNDSEH